VYRRFVCWLIGWHFSRRFIFKEGERKTLENLLTLVQQQQQQQHQQQQQVVVEVVVEVALLEG